MLTARARRTTLVRVAPNRRDTRGSSTLNGGYDLDFDDLANHVAKTFETRDKWLPNHGENLTFADLANFIIQAPTRQMSWPYNPAWPPARRANLGPTRPMA